MTLLVATSNPHKADEIREILHLQGARLISWADVSAEPLPISPEDGSTFEENAVQKARFYCERSGVPSLADDSGLEVDALDGRPGIQSARWMGEGTPYAEKNARLLEMLAAVPREQRGARFVCVAAVAFPDGTVLVGRGVHEGRIHELIAGDGGFGYDPVFFSEEAQTTFGRLDSARKNQISHRARAMLALRPQLVERFGGS